jgi:hypothetical protein
MLVLCTSILVLTVRSLSAQVYLATVGTGEMQGSASAIGAYSCNGGPVSGTEIYPPTPYLLYFYNLPLVRNGSNWVPSNITTRFTLYCGGRLCPPSTPHTSH